MPPTFSSFPPAYSMDDTGFFLIHRILVRLWSRYLASNFTQRGELYCNCAPSFIPPHISLLQCLIADLFFPFYSRRRTWGRCYSTFECELRSSAEQVTDRSVSVGLLPADGFSRTIGEYLANTSLRR